MCLELFTVPPWHPCDVSRVSSGAISLSRERDEFSLLSFFVSLVRSLLILSIFSKNLFSCYDFCFSFSISLISAITVLFASNCLLWIYLFFS